MRVRFLGKAGSINGDCPTLYTTERDTYLIQGWRTESPDTVEIPHVLLGFLEADWFIATPLIDTGRGTFRVTGRPLTDPDTLNKLTIADDEAVIEVPMTRRNYYGATATEPALA
ncbi:hypothetical protein [Nocardia fusca]|uniref:Uncharacterized protein n=1 Tax=Nocardia fusca TaxID=941183 RepID=A0ABV3F0W4_9NOCA